MIPFKNVFIFLISTKKKPILLLRETAANVLPRLDDTTWLRQVVDHSKLVHRNLSPPLLCWNKVCASLKVSQDSQTLHWEQNVCLMQCKGSRPLTHNGANGENMLLQARAEISASPFFFFYLVLSCRDPLASGCPRTPTYSASTGIQKYFTSLLTALTLSSISAPKNEAYYSSGFFLSF